MPDIFSLFATAQIQWIMTLICVDVILGIVAAVNKKEFEFRKLCDFMKGSVLGFVLGFAVIEMVGANLPCLSFAVPIIFVLIIVYLLASIARNLGKLGLPIPKALKK